MEQYLQVSANYLQDDWDDHLTTLEFAFNNSVSAVTNLILFKLDNENKPLVPIDLIALTKNVDMSKLEKAATTPAVEEFLTTMQNNLRFAQEQIKEVQDI